MKIIWTNKAKVSFAEIIENLDIQWSSKIVNNFVLDTKKTLSQIRNNPFMYVATKKNNNIRRGFINKHVSLFYKVKKDNNIIELLLFWSNRKNPNDLKY